MGMWCVHGAPLANFRLFLLLGFIQALVQDIWGVLEVADDNPIHIPRAWPVTPIDKYAQKVLKQLRLSCMSLCKPDRNLYSSPPVIRPPNLAKSYGHIREVGFGVRGK